MDGWDLSILLHISLVDGFSVVTVAYRYQFSLLFEYRSEQLAWLACKWVVYLTVWPLSESVVYTCSYPGIFRVLTDRDLAFVMGNALCLIFSESFTTVKFSDICMHLTLYHRLLPSHDIYCILWLVESLPSLMWYLEHSSKLYTQATSEYSSTKTVQQKWIAPEAKTVSILVSFNWP